MPVKSLEQINREFVEETRTQNQNVKFEPVPSWSELLAELSPTSQTDKPVAIVQLQPERSLLRDIGSLAVKIGIVIGIVLLIFNFVYGLHYNAEPGMNPSTKDGDLVMYYRWDKNYHAGDLVIVVFQGEKQIRRVIAAAGDTVDITEDGLYINGAFQQERDISEITNRYEDGVDFPLTVGEGQIFVLGDAREHAADSRLYGSVNIKDTHGKVITILRRRSM